MSSTVVFHNWPACRVPMACTQSPCILECRCGSGFTATAETKGEEGGGSKVTDVRVHSPFSLRVQVASGIPAYRADHCAALARLALDMQDALKKYKDASGEPLQARLPATFGYLLCRYFIFTFSWLSHMIRIIK